MLIDGLYEEGDITRWHCEAYEVLMTEWDEIVPDVLLAIIEYQNKNWGNTGYTQSFPLFNTVDDVLENVEFLEIVIGAKTHDYYQRQEDRYVVLVFSAEWVNNDYRLLSVALVNEKVVEVTDQSLTC